MILAFNKPYGILSQFTKEAPHHRTPVSYTHLDVYKRQLLTMPVIGNVQSKSAIARFYDLGGVQAMRPDGFHGLRFGVGLQGACRCV